MDAPEDFRRLCSLFYQGSREDFSTDLEWIAATLGYTPGFAKLTVKQYLDELLQSGATDAELRRLWRSVCPDYGFVDDKSARAFFVEIRDEAARQIQ